MEGVKGVWRLASLRTYFFEARHEGLSDMAVKIIVKTDINKPVERKGFWAYKLSTFVNSTWFKCYDFFLYL